MVSDVQRTPCVYHVDSEHRIVHVNDEWDVFAKENDAPDLTRDAVLGKVLWGYVFDRETRHLYRVAIEKVLSRKASVSFPFRCDAPHIRRHMRMEVNPLEGDRCQFTSTIVREEPRERVDLLGVDETRTQESLRMCSWCKKLDADEAGWLEVERGIEELDLFRSATLPSITHTICPLCFKEAMAQIRR
ncbi:MAG: hypothetical protein QGI83_05005 [Candidatus Latescibacteria bacterium]|jgi:hypothetical protein|nr:hypothetical protein [Candidatus Latescibacterota bacterium]